MIWSFHHAGWTIGCLICVIALGTMTAGWVTLLTPTNIGVIKGIHGNELDIGSSALDIFLNQPPPCPVGITCLKNPQFVPYSTPDIQLVIDANAQSSASRSFGIPSIVYFNGLSYNTSTGGTLGVRFNSSSSEGLPVPDSRIQVSGGYPQSLGFRSKYTVTQQGFTASVSCQEYDSSGVTCPIPSNAFGTTCNTSSSAKDPSTEVYVINGPHAYRFITPTVCTVVSKVTTVDVTYEPLSGVAQVTSTRNATTAGQGGSVLHSYIHNVVSDRLGYTLSLHNVFGNAVGFLYYSRRESNGTKEEKIQLLNTILEGYFVGIFEMTATLFRAEKSELSVHPNMSVAVNGTFQYEKLGWHHHSRAAIFVLFPVTIIVVLSIIAVAIGVKRPGDLQDDEETASAFDDSNPLHLAIAASAGDMGVFGGFDENYVEMAEQTRVQFDYVQKNAHLVKLL